MTDTPTIPLPTPPPPGANYVPARRHGDLLFIAGQLPFVDGRLPRTGKVGDAVDVPAAAELARLAALNGLAVADAHLGSLAGVSVVQVTVFVASSPDFTEQHLVANGASDLLIEALGERGRHARTAVAAPVLPLDTPVEVQLVLGVGAP